MVRSIAAIGTVLLAACAGPAAAKKFTLAETYDATNFFDKFDFFESKYNTGNPKDIDPAGGHVAYLNRENATHQGLIARHGNEVYVGVDSKTVGDAKHGRPSVRLESKKEYLRGLFIARFTHLPFNQCGVWPEFWTKGANRPHDGQIDIYEQWNESKNNHPALHTGLTSDVGECILDNVNQTAIVGPDNCDNNYEKLPKQSKGSGCSVTDVDGPWANPDGGIFAMEWTSEHLKLFTWHPSSAPADIASSSPDTSNWGTPALYVKNDKCNIDKHFGAQKLVLHTTFCGVAGSKTFWGETCKAKTGEESCISYVSNSPGDFKNVFWKIRDIRYFEEKKDQVSTSSASATSTPTSSKPITTISPGGNNTSTVDMTTSVIYTTRIQTITSCPPTVTNCPNGQHVTTVTVPLYTTVCPVTPSSKSSATPIATQTQCTGSSCSPNSGGNQTIPGQQPGGCNGGVCPPVVVNGAGKVARSLLAAVAAVVVFLL